MMKKVMLKRQRSKQNLPTKQRVKRILVSCKEVRELPNAYFHAFTGKVEMFCTGNPIYEAKDRARESIRFHK